jgi:hypothetical protein
MKVTIDLPNLESDKARYAVTHPYLSDAEVFRLALANGLIAAGWVGVTGSARLTLNAGRSVDMDWGSDAKASA